MRRDYHLLADSPLLCAGITTYSPIRRWGDIKGKKVGIVGLGGLGHMGVKFARAFGAGDEGIRMGRVAVGLAFTGGCLVPALLYAPLLWSARVCAGGRAALYDKGRHERPHS